MQIIVTVFVKMMMKIMIIKMTMKINTMNMMMKKITIIEIMKKIKNNMMKVIIMMKVMIMMKVIILICTRSIFRTLIPKIMKMIKIICS